MAHSRATRSMSGLLGLALSALLTGTAGGQTIGETITTTNVVLGSQVAGPYRRLKSTDPILRDQFIETRAASIGQFEFEDGTALAVGPDARIQLNEAVYGGPESHRLLSGSMRFVTTAATGRNDVVVTTPVATVGVRGTIFDLFVEALTGYTAALLVQGGPMQVCAASVCRTIITVCEAVGVSGGGAPGDVGPVNALGGPVPAAQMFPFAAGVHRTRSIFRNRAANCGVSAGRILFEPQRETGRQLQDEVEDVHEELRDTPQTPYTPPAPYTPPTPPPTPVLN